MRDKPIELFLSFTIATRGAIPRNFDVFKRIFGVFVVEEKVTRFSFFFRFTDSFIVWWRPLYQFLFLWKSLEWGCLEDFREACIA